MEKRRRHEQQYADFMRRQNAVGQYEYLNITTMNDHRFLTNYLDQTGELPTRATHEEFMDVRTLLAPSFFTCLLLYTCAAVSVIFSAELVLEV